MASPAACWRLRTTELDVSRRPLWMGIVNVTPDSFSDGGCFAAADQAVRRAVQLQADGADLIDIGGESTRPYAAPVAAAEELRRVAPVVREVCRVVSVPVSIDTTKAAVARVALDAGAQIINDVSGFTGDPRMIELAVAAEAGVCAMHRQGTPQTMQDDPRYEDVVAEVAAYLAQRRDALAAAGVDRRRICLDPGIGFGKTHEHNLTLLRACRQFHALGCPLLVGHSRKGFIGKVIGDPQADRTAGTIGAALALAVQGVQILRVHDVAAVRQAWLLFAAGGGVENCRSTA